MQQSSAVPVIYQMTSSNISTNKNSKSNYQMQQLSLPCQMRSPQRKSLSETSTTSTGTQHCSKSMPMPTATKSAQGTLFHFSWWKIVVIIIVVISLLYILWKVLKCYHRCKAKKAARKAEKEAKRKAASQACHSPLVSNTGQPRPV